ncbi:14261_t:CDS:1, partial [Racocetra persica]
RRKGRKTPRLASFYATSRGESQNHEAFSFVKGEKSTPQELPASYFLSQESKPATKAGIITKNKHFRFQ